MQNPQYLHAVSVLLRVFRTPDCELPRLLDEAFSVDPGLEDLPLVRKGNRLSVMPVGEEEWQIILNQAG